MVLTFDDVEIDLDRVEIRRAGATVEVRPQVFDVIEYLVRHRDRVVGRDELLDEVWGSRHVGDSTVASCIKGCRRALGDDGATQRFIRTVQGRGYRFVAEPSATQLDRDADDDDADDDASERRATAVDPAAQSEPPAGGATATAGEGGRGRWPFVGRVDELELVERSFADERCHGVRIVAPEGAGSSALAHEAARRLARRQVPTRTVIGSAAMASIPFAAVQPLCGPIEIPTDTGSAVEHSAVFHRAVAAARTSLADDGPTVVVIDEPARLDRYSIAVIRHLVEQRAVFALIAERSSTSPSGAFDDLSVSVAEVRLAPLGDADVDALLYRFLAGPIDQVTLDRLIEISAGRPRVLRDVVEASIAAGALRNVDGAWTFDGPPRSTASTSLPDDLSAGALSALQTLALAARLPLSTLVAAVGDESVDELDDRRLLAVVGDPSDPSVVLADPLLAGTVVDSIGPLRARAIRAELMVEMLRPDATPRAMAAAIAWADEVGTHVPVADLTRAAQAAMIEADLATAGTLVDHAGSTDDPNLALIDAEVSLQRNRWDRAEAVFASIDVEQLDDTSTAHVLRRRASIDFYRHGRFDETLDRLSAEAARRSPRIARALDARRMGMLAYLGRPDELLAMADEIDTPRGVSAIEMLMAQASGRLHRGEFDVALALMDEIDRRLADLPDVFVAEPRDGATAIRASTLLQLGRIAESSALVRAALPIGGRTPLGYLPTMAARIERAAGRPRAAREMLRQAVATSHREEFPHYVVAAEANAACVALDLGQVDAARAGLHRTIAGIASLSGELRWQAAIAATELSLGLGESRADLPSLIDLADEAGASGAAAREADLCFAAIVFGTHRDRRTFDRLREVSIGFGGALWPIRLRHAAISVGTAGDGEGDDAVAAAYTRLGFVSPAF